MTSRILVVEDDQEIRDLLRMSLVREGYEVTTAKDGEQGIELVNESLDLVILDIMMPGINGLEACIRIRERYNVPILFLTAKSGTLDKTEGLLAGGDDYLTKPFSEQELLARVIALLRRYTIYQDKKDYGETFLIGGRLKVSEQFNDVWKGSQKIELSDLEYGLLKLLMTRRNKIFSAQNIYESIWKEPYFYSSNNTVVVHIRKLRLKIEDDPAKPAYILTEWGRGYRFGHS
ncbi:response regulator transcription factor [Paenibacillus sp. FSL R5-0766]|uniref:response regulator transcription factor n=1 Tax=Paenibacillus TaxID=44249 RepID=UPI00096DF350|nr:MULTISPECIES: response regulator transcription factor [Paenibacillus]MCF7754919.1 response regulator transcription factor [Paenibacillus xylanexedens]OMF55097.1 DNA-binding response regulator [Paenibacillus sp. FSL R5-0765]